MWVHPLVSQRLLKGQFHQLFDDLCEYPDKFWKYFRMSKKSFDELLFNHSTTYTLRNYQPPHTSGSLTFCAPTSTGFNMFYISQREPRRRKNRAGCVFKTAAVT